MRSPGSPELQPVGVVLAGGAGRRLGTSKATVAVGGRPLLSYPLRALRGAVTEVVVQTKPDSTLPELPGLTVWSEPAQPRHPLVGLVHALERAGPRGVLVCAVDMPFVSAALLSRLAAMRDGAAAVAVTAGRVHPLLGHYRPAALGPLREALAREPHGSLTSAVRALAPATLEAPTLEVMNLNTPEDLRQAEVLLANRR